MDGPKYNSEQLVKKVTGKALSEETYCHYLNKKYAELYSIRHS